MTPCDMADCPHEGTNEMPCTLSGLGETIKTTIRLCDRCFRAIHASVTDFSLGLEARAK